MSQGQGSISSNELMKKLVQSKKIMNKVDGGNYERGHVNESMLLSDPEELMKSQYVGEQPQPNQRPVNGPTSVDRIHNSKLPDAIKRAMIESPIPQISLNDTLDMDFVKGAKRLMEQEGVSSKKLQPQQRQPQSSNIDMNAIALMIENTVRKVMDEKLNQILSASTTASINENLVLKVGESIFKGKITGVSKAK